MSDYKKYAKSIKKGELPYENWKRLNVRYRQNANRMAGVGMALSLAIEAYAQYSWQEEILETFGKRLLSVLWKAMDTGFSRAENEKDILELRADMKNVVDCLLMYIDKFSLYRFALELLKFNYEKSDYKGCSDKKLIDRLNEFVASDEEADIVNDKISKIMKIMPVCMTRKKLFDHVKEALEFYKDSDMDTLKRLEYNIRSVCALDEPEDMEKFFPELYKYCEHYDHLDFSALNPDSYHIECINVNTCSEFMRRVLSALTSFVEINHYLLVFVMTNDCADRAQSYYNDSLKVLSYIRENVTPGRDWSEEDEFLKFLEKLEGVQEYSIDHHMEAISALEEAANGGILKMDDLREEVFDDFQINLLMTDNYFADARDVTDSSPITQEAIDDVLKRFCEDLEPRLKAMKSPMRKAVMSAIIYEVPPTFDDVVVFRDYLYSSLSACTNPQEKLAVSEKLENLMETYDDMDMYEDEE